MKLNFCWYCNCLYDCCIYMMPADFCISHHFVVDAIFGFGKCFDSTIFFLFLLVHFIRSFYVSFSLVCMLQTYQCHNVLQSLMLSFQAKRCYYFEKLCKFHSIPYSKVGNGVNEFFSLSFSVFPRCLQYLVHN